MVVSMKKFVKRAGNAILFGSNHAHPHQLPHSNTLQPLSASTSPDGRRRSLSAVASLPDLRYLSLTPRATKLASSPPSVTGGTLPTPAAAGSKLDFSDMTTPLPVGNDSKRSLFKARADPLMLLTPLSGLSTPNGSDDELEIETPESVMAWTVDDVALWLTHSAGQPESTLTLFRQHSIDGPVLLTITELDLKTPPISMASFGDMRRLIRNLDALRRQLSMAGWAGAVTGATLGNGVGTELISGPGGVLVQSNGITSMTKDKSPIGAVGIGAFTSELPPVTEWSNDTGASSWSTGSGYQAWVVQENLMSIMGKFVFSLAYVVFVVFATAFVMVLVHERVPDSAAYPPLPDIVLDNVPFVPFAFTLVEIFICSLAAILVLIIMFHQNRFVILRRFNAVVGTCFLIRTLTMYITSLSVPGTHLDCKPYIASSLTERLERTWQIASGFGLSISGVNTCGDYMFSGHTVALTNLNYFVNEYSPTEWKGLHIFSWILNVFGMFLILAAHEHYSIDVFIAFYISSRLFCRYHSMTNVAAVLSQHGKKNYEEIDGWFPFVSYLEEYANGVVPNTYEMPWTSLTKFIAARRAWAKAALARARKNQKDKERIRREKLAAKRAAAAAATDNDNDNHIDDTTTYMPSRATTHRKRRHHRSKSTSATASSHD